MQKNEGIGRGANSFSQHCKKKKHSTDVLNLHYKLSDEGFF